MDPRRESQRYFAGKAQAYRQSASHANREDLDRMLALVGAGDAALDVATGGGHTATALAQRFRRVLATDLTREMLVGLSVPTVAADAQRLPLRDRSFDVVASRIAPHHVPDLTAFVREAARVLRPGGRLYVFDLTTPEDPAAGAWIDGIERLRDPSHLRSWPLSAWRAATESGNLLIDRLERTSSTFPLEPWIARAAMPRERERELRARLAAPPAGVEGYGASGATMRVLRVELLATKRPQS